MAGSAVVSGSLKLFTSRFSVSLISLAFYGIAAHLVPKSELAPLAAMAVIAELFRVARSLGLPDTMLRRVPEHIAQGQEEEAGALVRSTLLYTSLASLVLVAAAWAFHGAISQLILKRRGLGLDMAIILAFALLMGIYDTLQLALLSLQWFGRQGLAYFITLAGQRLLALGLLFFLGVRGCLLGFLMGALAGVCLLLFWLRRYVFGPWGGREQGRASGAASAGGQARWVGFASLLRYSLPYYVQGFARYVLHEGDQLLVGVLLTPELLVSFFIAKRLIHGLRMLIDATTDVLRPKMGELRARGGAAVQAGFQKSSRFISYAVLPVTLGVAAVSQPLVLLYAGRDYADAGPILLVLCLAMALYGYFSLFEVNIYMLGRPAERLYVDLVTAAVMLVAVLVLVFNYVGLGIALAELVAFGLGLIFAARLFRRVSDARVDAVAFRRTFRASGAAFVLVALASHWLAEPYFLPLLLACGGSVFLLLFSISIRRRETEEIREALPRAFHGCVLLVERIGEPKDER